MFYENLCRKQWLDALSLQHAKHHFVFLRRQTLGQLAREKGGLVCYVNVSVDDNCLALGHMKELTAKEKALRLSLQRKQFESDMEALQPNQPDNTARFVPNRESQ